jgi:hypothetical protein
MATNKFLIVISILLEVAYLAVSVDVTVMEQGVGRPVWLTPCPMSAVTCVKAAEEGPATVGARTVDSAGER